MLSIAALLLFSISLIVCLLCQWSILYALLFGACIFFIYGLLEGHSLSDLFQMVVSGVLTVKNILIVFLLIGMITATWRASGTIAMIIFLGSKLVFPSIFVLLSFLLCALLSILIGTALGTAATMGVICISIARAMGINEFFVAGAVLSGVYFGDRCSPMSSSALLISELTETNIFENIKAMIKTSVVPFSLTCIFYLFLGMRSGVSTGIVSVTALFEKYYHLHYLTLLPAVLMLLLSILKVNVRVTMGISIVLSFLIAYFLQGEPLGNLLYYLLYGYIHSNTDLNTMMQGGGILSMWRVSLIVGISSSYSGIFAKTKILKKPKEYIKILSNKMTDFGAVLVTGTISCIIACNQSLAVIMTQQLCQDIMRKEKLAITLENTVITVAALVPWSIAMAVPFQALEVPNVSAFYAVYLYFIPLWNLGMAVKRK